MAAQVGDSDGDIGFQIAPMVDVVFVLLLFFMASAATRVSEREIGIIRLPSDASVDHSPVAPASIIVEIDADGRVSVNDRSFGSATDRSLTDLQEWLTVTLERFGDRDPVIIRPFPETRHERIVEVLDAAVSAGVKNVTFG
jgi:biopolymer transport protein ExbD